MSDIIFALSIWGSFLTSLVLILGLLTKNRFYKTLQYCMWIIVILRFLIPIFPEINIKNDSGFDKILAPPYNNVTQNIPVTVDVSDNYKVPTENIDIPNKIDIIKLILDNVWFIWLTVFIILYLLNTILYLRFKQKLLRYNISLNNIKYNDCLNKCRLKLGIKRKINLFQNSYISTPMLVGIIKPIILIPAKDFEIEDLELIYNHELMHYKKHDMLIKYITNFAVCVHWFNPFIYLVRNQINRYCELSCDESVIKILDKKYYKAYGDIILKIAQTNIDKNITFVSTLNSDKNILKERLRLIMNYKTITKKAVAISTSLLVSISTVAVFCGTTFASNPSTENAVTDTTQYTKLSIDDLTKEEIDFFSDLLNREGKDDSIYKVNRDTSNYENEMIDKYGYQKPKPKNDLPIDDKTAEFYYDTAKLSFILPDRELTKEEILEYWYFKEKVMAVSLDISTKKQEEAQKKELSNLTDKDISKEKAEELIKNEIKKMYPDIDIASLPISINLDYKMKSWDTASALPSYLIRSKVDVETGEIVNMMNYTEVWKDAVDSNIIKLEEAKKTDIWKTESEKFLKSHLKENRTPTNIFSFAVNLIKPIGNGKVEEVPGNTICTVFKYDDNTFRRIYISYDTHKVIGYEHERLIDINNRVVPRGIPEGAESDNSYKIYKDSPDDVDFLVEVYK